MVQSMNRPQNDDYQTYNLSSSKNYCDLTHQMLSKSSSDGATYSKYQLLNKLGRNSEIKNLNPPNFP